MTDKKDRIVRLLLALVLGTLAGFLVGVVL